MLRSVRGLLGAVSLGAVGAVALAATPVGAAGTNGNGKPTPDCTACHGKDGGGLNGVFPRLAGLNARYMQRQLDDFVNGTRPGTPMTAIAATMTKASRQAWAVTYANMPVRVATPGATVAADDARGRQLAERGDWAKDVPACDACHGPGGVGVGANFPPLAQQPANYLSAQLHAFKDGKRHNDPLGLMQHIAAALSDHDIDAVSAWFAAQPAAPRGGKR